LRKKFRVGYSRPLENVFGAYLRDECGLLWKKSKNNQTVPLKTMAAKATSS